MKFNKKAFLISCLVIVPVAAIVAIPTALILSKSSSSDVDQISVDYSKDMSKAIDFAWGTDTKLIPPPPLDVPGYSDLDFARKKPPRTTFSNRDYYIGDNSWKMTELGLGKATATFTYIRYDPSFFAIDVKYPLNVIKGPSKNLVDGWLSNSGTYTRNSDHSYFTNIKWFNNWSYENGYGYVLDDSVSPNPSFLGPNGPVKEDEVDLLPNWTVVERRIAIKLDTEHYEDEGQPLKGFVSDDFALHDDFGNDISPGNWLEDNVPTLPYGTDFTMLTKDDVPGKVKVDDYELKSATPFGKITGRALDASSPSSLDTPFDAREVKHYAPFTTFRVVFTFGSVKAGQKGDDYTYNIDYSIAPPPADPQEASARQLPDVAVAYKGFGLSEPSAPAFDGYTGKYDSATVIVQKPVFQDPYNPFPKPGQAITPWSRVNDADAGAEFNVNYSYQPNAGTSGQPFSLVQKYKVEKQPFLALPTRTMPEDTTSQHYGVNAWWAYSPEPPFTLFDFSDKYFYKGDKVDPNQEISEWEATYTPVGQKFTVETVYRHSRSDDSNYDIPRRAFVNVSTFVVNPSLGYYDGSLHYKDVEMVAGDTLPEDFVPAKWDTPDPQDDRHPTYVFDSVLYYVTESPDVHLVKTFVDLKDVSTYPAGTVIRARVTFKPNAPNYYGRTLTCFRLLKIVAA